MEIPSSTVYVGKGVVSLALLDSSGAMTTPFRPIGNVPGLSLKMDVEKGETRESMSGLNVKTAEWVKGTSVNYSMEVDNFDKKTYALFTSGTYTAQTSVTPITGKALAGGTAIAVGDRFDLGAMNVSAVAIKDSTATPKTLTKDVNYKLDADTGVITIIDITTGGAFTGPLKADFTPGAYDQIKGMTQTSGFYALLFEGINQATNKKEKRTIGNLTGYDQRMLNWSVTGLRDFGSGNLLLLWRDYLNWEVCEIQSLTTSQVTLKKATIYSWTANDRIIPVRLGRLSKNLQIARPTSTLAEATLTFSFEIGDAVDANRLGTSSWLQYNGLDVLTLPPNAASGDLDETYDRDIETVDYDKGAWYSQCNTAGPNVSRPYSWLLKTRQEIMNFLAFLESKRGKHVPFYMPTWSKDLEQIKDMGATDLNILVKNIGYTRYIKMHANRSLLIFYPSDGSTPIVKSITGSVESANNTETISLNSSFGAIKKPTDFKAISFLTYCRFDQDAFELTWHSDSLVEVSTRIREVLQ